MALIAERKDDIRLLLDSGAFTAWKTGKPIALDDYCKFLEALPIEPFRYFMLDVVGDPDATLKNYETMLKRGFKPVPIFTRGAEVSMLNRYYKTSDCVGIGGLVGTRGSPGFVNGIMEHVRERKVHLLGFNRIEYLKIYKPYSCDSTNFLRAQKYGWLDVYLGYGEMVHLIRRKMHTKPEQRVLDRIASYGFDPYELRNEQAWRGTRTGALVPYYSWVNFSLDAERDISTLVFLACASSDVPIALEAYGRLKA